MIRSVEFYNIELAPLADGRVYVSVLATTVDDEEPQLLTQEIACETVATIEDALAVIRQSLSRPLAIPPAIGGRTTKSRRQSRRLFPSANNDCRRPVRTSRSKNDRRALGCGSVASVPFECPPVVRHQAPNAVIRGFAASDRRRAKAPSSIPNRNPASTPYAAIFLSIPRCFSIAAMRASA